MSCLGLVVQHRAASLRVCFDSKREATDALAEFANAVDVASDDELVTVLGTRCNRQW